MPLLTIDPQIAAGWNNAAGLASITSLTDADGIPFVRPSVLRYRRGNRRTRANSTPYFAGYPSTTWLFHKMSVKQYKLLYTNYEAGNSDDHKVTIRTLDSNGDAANYNAIMKLPESADLTVIQGQFPGVMDCVHTYPGVEVKFRRLEAI